MTLNRLRKQIDRIDRRLLTLLNQRARLALRVGEMKRRQGRPLLDQRREAQILRRVKLANAGPFSSRTIEGIFRQILRSCRRLQ